MSLKICYDDEIHKISKLPLNILDLRNKVDAVFHDNLPTNYRLEYLDSDGDRIVISNNTIYRELVDQGLPTGSKPLKIYVAYFNANRQKNKANAKVTNQKGQTTGPIHIQNKEEFAEDLPKPDRSEAPGRSGREEAPSDESLPSSAEDHEEKVHEIYESVEELKKEGGAKLHPEIYDDPDSEKEMKREKGEKKEYKEYKGEKEQTKMRKLMDQIREKELSEEKKEKVVKKLIKYKERLAEKQKERTEKPVKQRKEKETKPKYADNKNPIESVISHVIQSMMPEITRLVGEHHEVRGERGQVRQAQQKVIHPRIICDGCHMRPITGVRYKCTVCPNFDYCEGCEENMGHPHPFIKIKTPQQDYFAHGHFYDNANRRNQVQRYGAETVQHLDHPEPIHQRYDRYVPVWVPKVGGQQIQEPVQQTAQRTQETVKEEPVQQAAQRTQNVVKEKPKAVRTQKVQKTQQQRQYVEKPRVDSWEKLDREKENYAKKTDRSDEVEIEDETHLLRDAERYNVIKEGKELRQRQNQSWIPNKDEDFKGLEKERRAKETSKEHLGDVKAKASKLKKEFPDTKFDTLLRYVEEAPEDLTTEELVNNFVAWK